MTTAFRNIVLLMILSFGFNVSYAQEDIKDTLIIIGQREVDTPIIKLSKKDFLKSGKIKTNYKGWSVNNYNFSMFALGSSIKCAVNDSMFTKKLREAVLNESINYRYINIEGVTIIDKQGNIKTPKIDTVKVKFKYQ